MTGDLEHRKVIRGQGNLKREIERLKHEIARYKELLDLTIPDTFLGRPRRRNVLVSNGDATAQGPSTRLDPLCRITKNDRATLPDLLAPLVKNAMRK